GPLVHGRRRRRSAFVLLSVPFVTSGGTSAYGVRSRLGRQSTRPPRETAIYADRHARRLRLLNGGELKHRSAAACPQDLGDDRGDGAPARRTGAGAPLIKDERPGADLQSITAGNAGNKKIPNVRHKCEAYSPSLRRSSSPAAPQRRQGVLARAPQAPAPPAPPPPPAPPRHPRRGPPPSSLSPPYGLGGNLRLPRPGHTRLLSPLTTTARYAMFRDAGSSTGVSAGAGAEPDAPLIKEGYERPGVDPKPITTRSR